MDKPSRLLKNTNTRTQQPVPCAASHESLRGWLRLRGLQNPLGSQSTKSVFRAARGISIVCQEHDGALGVRLFPGAPREEALWWDDSSETLVSAISPNAASQLTGEAPSALGFRHFE
jgi:hypothetical protein